jgi:hypothetical protein
MRIRRRRPRAVPRKYLISSLEEPFVQARQDPEHSPVAELVTDEVHTPTLIRAHRHRRRQALASGDHFRGLSGTVRPTSE